MGQRRVLKAVILYQHIRPVTHGEAQALHSIGTNINRPIGGHHQRFITDIRRQMLMRIDFQRAFFSPAIAARQNRGRFILRRQTGCQPSNGRGFSGPSGGQIADTNHRLARMLGMGEFTIGCLQTAIQQRQRRQSQADRMGF